MQSGIKRYTITIVKSHVIIKTVWVLVVTLFLLVQGVSQAHATANGGFDHTHDGIACDVALVAAEQVVLTPPFVVKVPVELTVTPFWQPRIVKNPPRNFDGRAPPPRAPPTL